jgi:hypothetical protein
VVDRFRHALHHSVTDQWLTRTWGLHYSLATGDQMGHILIGHDGYLFYGLDFAACTGPAISSDPSSEVNACIYDYNSQLERRGIHLILLPVPAKAAMMPSKLLPDYPVDAGPALNAGYRKWIGALRAHGVDVVDLTDDFWAMARRGQSPFQPPDSHWMPEAWALAAQRLAEHARPFLGDYPRIEYTTRSLTVFQEGDLVTLMGLTGGDRRWPPTEMHLTQVLRNGARAAAGSDARLLMLGDSYSFNYSNPDLETGSSGLSHQLMLRLGAEVQLITRVAPALIESRIMLSERPGALRSKRIVIWEFTSRELPTKIVALPDP